MTHNGHEAAFGHGAENGHCCGLTIREHFAGLAMQGMGNLIRWDGAYSDSDRKDNLSQKHAKWIADAAVRQADALIAALNEDAGKGE